MSADGKRTPPPPKPSTNNKMTLVYRSALVGPVVLEIDLTKHDPLAIAEWIGRKFFPNGPVKR